MMALMIEVKNQKKAEKITDFLLSNDMVFSSMILPSIIVKTREGNKVVENRQCLVISKTKALLFEKVIDKMNAEFPGSLVYGLPIAAMDWIKFEKLSADLRKV